MTAPAPAKSAPALAWIAPAACLVACLVVTTAHRYVAPSIACLLSLLFLLVWVAIEPRSRAPFQVMGLVLFYFVFWSKAADYLLWVDRNFPQKFEPLLMNIELRLGIPISIFCARVYSRFHSVEIATDLMYVSLAYAMALCYAWHLKHPQGKPRIVLSGYILTFVTGPLLYPLLPACGPVHAFTGYPNAPLQATAAGSMLLHGIPNCAPSLHMAMAFLLYLYRLPERFAQWALALFALGTAWATLATGEHYVVDLVLSLPFTWFVRSAVEREWPRAVLWLSATAGLMLLLRASAAAAGR